VKPADRLIDNFLFRRLVYWHSFIFLGDGDLVVPLAFRLEFNAVKKLDITHEAGHNQPTLGVVEDLGDLRCG